MFVLFKFQFFEKFTLILPYLLGRLASFEHSIDCLFLFLHDIKHLTIIIFDIDMDYLDDKNY